MERKRGKGWGKRRKWKKGKREKGKREKKMRKKKRKRKKEVKLRFFMKEKLGDAIYD